MAIDPNRAFGLQQLQRRLNRAVVNGLRTTEEYSTRVSQIVGESVGVAARDSTKQTEKGIKQIEKRLQDKAARQRINKIIGERARDAALNSYRQTVKRKTDDPRGRGSPQNPRYSGGMLGNALASDKMFHADADNVRFPNTAWLDQQAKQWHRLNFGAVPHKPVKRRPRIRIAGETVGTIGFNQGPSPMVMMPKGFFVSYSEGQAKRVPFSPGAKGGRGRSPAHTFWPRRGAATATIPAKGGVEPRAFLEAGLAAMAKSAGELYTNFLFENAQQAKRSFSKTVRVNRYIK